MLGGRVVCGDDRKVDRIKENFMWSSYKFLAGPSDDLSRFRPRQSSTILMPDSYCKQIGHSVVKEARSV